MKQRTVELRGCGFKLGRLLDGDGRRNRRDGGRPRHLARLLPRRPRFVNPDDARLRPRDREPRSRACREPQCRK